MNQPTMTYLLQLIDAIKAATGPDRELDGKLWQVRWALRGAWAYPKDWEPPHYTNSIDDAMTLAPEGSNWFFLQSLTSGGWQASVMLDDPVEHIAATAPLAVCLASLENLPCQ